MSSRADPAIRGFSALHVSVFPLSSMEGLKVRTLVVKLPSDETVSLLCLSLEDPIHQDITAGGFDPALLQSRSTGFPADIGRGPPSNFTDTGRTVK